jgi:hypothetical protein
MSPSLKIASSWEWASGIIYMTCKGYIFERWWTVRSKIWNILLQ